ncbi:MAG: 2Fe-2S iron-sulfur cluster-binding protein, partial [Candidatus Hydrogenedentota bacterium]
MKDYRLNLTVNGREESHMIDPRDTLLDFLRETVWLTGSKEGCGKGECGACTVMMDDVTVNSCLVMAVQAEGRNITTVEGLTVNRKYHPLQEAMLECGGAQCGICTPGFIMSAASRLKKNL